MAIVSLANPKGGAGKTTTVIQASVKLAEMGDRVLAIDADPNMYLTQWANDREQQINEGYDLVKFPVYSILDAKKLITTLTTNEDKYDWIFIDTPGFDSGLNRLALASSAIAIFASKPGGLDQKSIPQISAIAQQLKEENPILQCYFYGTALSTNHKTIQEDVAFIQGITDALPDIHAFPSYSQHRTGYQRCTALGLAPQEMGNKDINREVDEFVEALIQIEQSIIDSLEEAEA